MSGYLDNSGREDLLSGGSRMIGRLEQHGLVGRSLCDDDRRGIYVCLTDAGRRRHAEALPTQRAVLAATLQVGRARRH